MNGKFFGRKGEGEWIYGVSLIVYKVNPNAPE